MKDPWEHVVYIIETVFLMGRLAEILPSRVVQNEEVQSKNLGLLIARTPASVMDEKEQLWLHCAF